MRIILLGSPTIERDSQPVLVQRRPSFALLAYLATTGQTHSRDSLAVLIWPKNDRSGARANLRRALSRLKQQVGEGVLAVDRQAVSLVSGSYRLDVAEFQEKVAQAHQHHHQPENLCHTCLEALQAAAAVYTGDFMAGFSLPDKPEFEEWQYFQREGYRQLLIHVLQQLIGWFQAYQAYGEASLYARQWVSVDPFHEPAHRELMRFYALAGEQAAALHQFETYKALLAEELGVSPTPETIELHEAIRANQVVSSRAQADYQTPPPAERYRQGELIAVGGHGEVYLGEDRVTAKPVVIKRLKPELVSVNPEVVTRFKKEGEGLRRLNHPNIVRMLATIEEDGEHRIVMEYVSGGTLRDLLEKNEVMSLGRVLDIFLELADALTRAHHLNIIHRDLKPSNVLLAADGTPRLTDFGVARFDKQDVRLTRPGSFIGSPAYMSPELLQNETPDTRSDIWSFGVLLYEFLSGSNPFMAAKITAVLINILQATVPPIQEIRPDVPPALADLLQRMLVKERDGRISSMRQVAAELEAIRAGRPVEKTPSLPFTPPGVAAAVVYAETMPTPLQHNLPAEPTPFIGRKVELKQIEEYLADPDCRLLTIVALGGMGKTRLAVAGARRLQKKRQGLFPDGVIFVSFVGVESAEVIPVTLARALDMRLVGTENTMTAVCNALRERQILIVLDNCEQLMEGVVLFNQLLQACPDLKLLATSREPLNIEAEWRVELEGLPFLDRSLPLENVNTSPSDAVQLFLMTARQVQPGFGLTAETLPSVGQVCQLVAGMPLAIKLAATWLRVMSCARIAEELTRNMDILTSRMRDLPPRQRSMHAVFEQTWTLLSASEQSVFQSISVFRGGFSNAAVDAVIGTSTYWLVGLVERGLVQQVAEDRYEVHELTRQFAAEKLDLVGHHAVYIQRHGTYYLQWVAGQKEGLHSQLPHLAVAAMRRDIENLRQALLWAVAHEEISLIYDAIEPLATFYELGGLVTEGAQVFAQAVSRLEDSLTDGEGTAVICLLHIKTALLNIHRSDYVDIQEQMQKAAAIAEARDSDYLRAHVYHVRAFSRSLAAEPAAAVDELQKSVEIFAALNEQYLLLTALHFYGETLARMQQPEEALTQHRQALLIAAELGDAREEALALSYIGHSNYYRENYQECIAFFEKANDLFEQVDDTLALARTTSNIGHTYSRLGDYEKADTYVQRAIPLFKKAGSATGPALDIVGDIHLARGAYGEARRAYEQGVTFAREGKNIVFEAVCRNCLGKLDIETGRYETAQEHIEYALQIVEEANYERYIPIYKGQLGIMYRRWGQLDIAGALLDEVIRVLTAVNHRYYTCQFLVEQGERLHELGDYEGARRQAAEGLAQAEKIGRSPVIFGARLLLASSRHALGEGETAVTDLEALLEKTKSPPQRAAIHYDLWQMRQSGAAARAALAIYEELVVRIPNITYIERIRTLQAAGYS